MPCVSSSSCWLPASLMRRHRNRASAKRGAKLEPSLSTRYLCSSHLCSLAGIVRLLGSKHCPDLCRATVGLKHQFELKALTKPST